jgi:hypothetical protein
MSDDDYVSIRKGAVLYSFSNDASNLYLDMKITETSDQNKILQMGMTLWLNADGKARQTLGIRFPIGSKFSVPRGQEGPMAPSPLALAKTIQLVGFSEDMEARLPSDNTDNIRGAIKYDDDGNLIYNLVVPFDKLPESGQGGGQDATVWTFGLEYGAPPAVNRPASGQGQSSAFSSSAPARGGRGSRTAGRSGVSSARPGGTGPAADPPVLIWVRDLKAAAK